MNTRLMSRVFVAALLASGVIGFAADAPAGARKLAHAPLANPRSIAVDASGNLYVADVDSAKVYKITPEGNVTTPGSAAIQAPIGVTVSAKGVLYVADADNGAVYKVSTDGTVTPLPKSNDAPLAMPTSMAADSAGNAYITNNGSNCILKITPEGAASVFAGKAGASGGADGTGAAASFATPRGIAVDTKDNIYVADEGNSNIRKITPSGAVTTLAGNAGKGGSADGTGTSAGFAGPRALAVDAAGNVFVADTDNDCIRKITPEGKVTTIAGTAGQSGNTDGTGAAARFAEPRGVAVDAAGNVYVADSGNGAVRQITPAGVVSTIVTAPAVAK